MKKSRFLLLTGSILFFCCYCFYFVSYSGRAVYTQSILGSKTKKDLLKAVLSKIEQLDPKFISTKKKDFKELRKRQILILKDKYLAEKIDLDFVGEYLKFTEQCLKKRTKCLELKNNYFANFYTEIKQADLEILNNSIFRLAKNLENLNYKRAFILNKLFENLDLAIQEVENSNDDSSQGDFIRDFFKSSGIYDPEQSLGSRLEWAWCSAFVTSVINQSGANFSYLNYKDLSDICLDKIYSNKESFCHPVQVDFILNWAEKKQILEQLTSFKLRFLKVLPGDILIQYNHQEQKATHIGFFLAFEKVKNSKKTEQTKFWIYSIEGNTGPFINDALEKNWQEIKKLNLKTKDYQRLLDRLTIVKRPLSSWDFFVSVETF